MNFAKISCPFCNASIDAKTAVSGKCHTCDQKWQCENNILVWNSTQYKKIKNKWQQLITKIKNQFTTSSSYFLPFRYIANYLTEKYYRLILEDDEYAKKWQKHYLADLNIHESDEILDLNCGRGRISAICQKLGYRAYAQDITAHMWWKKLTTVNFQVTPPNPSRLPWRDESFTAVFNVQVINYFDSDYLVNYIKEIHRVLKPGGYLIMLEPNAMGNGQHVFNRHYGQIHTVSHITDICKMAGFNQISLSYEGYYARIAPMFINLLRQFTRSKKDLFDYGSVIEAKTPLTQRALFLMKLQKI